MSLARQVARRLGYDLRPLRKARAPDAQLAALLAHHGITLVLDVGANLGQHARRLRALGYRGRIVSFEPLAAAHAALTRAAAGDPAWQAAPRMAIGAQVAEVEIEVSAETDMSSLRPQSALLRRLSPSSAVRARERVPLRPLDEVALSWLQPADRVLLKIDTQGFEAEVLDGAAALLPRLAGVQLELSLVPLYEGQPGYRLLLERLERLGFALHLVLPGYFERKLARQVEFDGVFMRPTER
jgi:FkbM family methyltransferase